MVKPKPHAYGMKSCEIVCYIAVFLMSKVDPCLFMYKTVIYMVYVDIYLFGDNSQFNIDKVMKYFKWDGPS